MTAFECYIEYLRIKNHFIRKRMNYNSLVRATYNSFERRNDKAFFHRLSKISDPKGFLIANFINNPNLWIGDIIISKESISIYRDWKRRMAGIEYYFHQDLKKLDEDFNKNFYIDNGQIPYIMKLYIMNNISPETVVILLQILSIEDYWNKGIKDPLFEETFSLIKNYSFFIHVDLPKMKEIIKNYFNK